MSELYVLDFDRTLADTDDMFDKLCEVTEQIDPELKQELIDYNNERTAKGDERPMFRPGDVLGDRKTEVFRAFIDSISEEEREYIYEDAKRFLEKIKKLGKAAVILTFGDSEWQRAKIDATLGSSELDLPVKITEEKIKSKTIKDFFNEETGQYEFGSQKADKIIGVGDRLTDVEGYDDLPNAKGHVLDPHDRIDDPLPSNSSKIKSFDELDVAA